MKNTLFILSLALTFFFAGNSFAEKVAEKVTLSAAFSMSDTLKTMMSSKAPVEIVLQNGKTYGGMVKEVSNGNVVLTRLSQKEFYDAVIRIENISALEVRVRDR